jgi:uncharacterized protein (DUF924 family)|tara:strand:+ start:189262 stop:189798 length:537 start_codon:yes stop_codon:yes gene_type:complete
MLAEAILTFWFNQLSPAQWWKKDAEVDQLITQQFSIVHHQATSGELFGWRATARGCLAEVIILDQFSRNMFRGTPQSFAYDGMALSLAQEAIRRSLDQELSLSERSFLYMPFMHSESLAIHQQALNLFLAPGLEQTLDFEKQHLEIIKRFGRYPHRNAILNRTSTDEEKEFLKQHAGF